MITNSKGIVSGTTGFTGPTGIKTSTGEARVENSTVYYKDKTYPGFSLTCFNSLVVIDNIVINFDVTPPRPKKLSEFTDENKNDMKISKTFGKNFYYPLSDDDPIIASKHPLKDVPSGEYSSESSPGDCKIMKTGLTFAAGSALLYYLEKGDSTGWVRKARFFTAGVASSLFFYKVVRKFF